MNNKILLSFIIPVYNVESYIEECIDSILNQCTSECEIVLVDDGSTDNSGKICDDFGEKYDFIHIIHKENGGLSSARNAGLAIATGKYITFVDSDDRIVPDCVKRILEWIKQNDIDICFLEWIKFFSDGVVHPSGENITSEGIHNKEKSIAIEYLSKLPKYPGSAWGKLYKKAFLDKNDLRFPHDRRLSEDLGFMMDCLLTALSFDCLEFPYYEYRQGRTGSITNQISLKRIQGVIIFISESVDKLTVNGDPIGENEKLLMSFVAYEYMICMTLLYLYNGNDKNDSLNELRRFKGVLKYGRSKRVKLVYFLSRIVGLHCTARVLGTYFRLRK